MAKSSPNPETVRFIIEILSARKTPVSEVAATIENIWKGFQSISGAAPQKLVPPTPPVKVKLSPRVVAVSALGKIRRIPVVHTTDGDQPGDQSTGDPSDATAFFQPTLQIIPPAAALGITAPRKRGRPRKIVPVAFLDPDEEPMVDEVPEPILEPTPQTLSLRRASRVQTESSIEAQVSAFAPQRATGGPIRGVVKWYDGRAGKGALRLTGISGDVAFDGDVLTRCGINRLYKDQEIEAVVEESSGRVRLISMSLPARNAEGSLSGPGGESLGSLRRNRNPVTVEIKQTSVKQRAARAEAEHVLGGVGRIKITRRLIP